MSEASENLNHQLNPLDCVEEIIDRPDWAARRLCQDELLVTGRTDNDSTVRMTFIWQEEYAALQMFCEMDLRIPQDRLGDAECALQAINRTIWLGHFDMQQDGVPCFRYTTLLPQATAGLEEEDGIDPTRYIQDLMDIAMAECERHYTTFSYLASGGTLDRAALTLAATDAAGQA